MGLLTIGAFAHAARLTPKALRLYDEGGLLPPAAVDPESGYRFYHPSQLARARLIAKLRHIGMPLADIRTVCDLEPHAAAEAVTAYWDQVTAATATRARQVALLVDHLTRKGSAMSDTPAAVIQEGTTRTQRIVRSTLDKVAEDIQAAGIRPPAIIVIGPVAGLSELG